MASDIAGTSTIFASVVFHCAPNAADPSLVIKSTTKVGGREGATAGRSACAVAIVPENAAAAAASASRTEPFLSISVSSSTISKQDLNLTLDRGVGKAKCAARVAMTGGLRLRSAPSDLDNCPGPSKARSADRAQRLLPVTCPNRANEFDVFGKSLGGPKSLVWVTGGKTRSE